MTPYRLSLLAVLLLGCLTACEPTMAPATPVADQPSPPSPAAQEAQRLDSLPPVTPHGEAALDPSGRPQAGKASWYGSGNRVHQHMADGHRMDPSTNVAASKTLPIGSTAKVTNLENGKAATVTIEDRGPFVNGRVVDVSPHVAQQLALKKSGVAPVIVEPITVPQPGGGVKLGAGAVNASPQEVAKAAKATEKLTGKSLDEASSR